MKKSPFDFLFAARAARADEVVPFAEGSALPEAALAHAAPHAFDTDNDHEDCDHDHDSDLLSDPDALWLESDDHVFDVDWAAAKPVHAGGGGGGGKGRGKDKPVEEEPTGGTDGGTTGGTDGGTTGGTDGGTTGGTDGGTTGGTGGGGSGDFGWVSDTRYVSGGDTPDGFNIALNFEGSGWTDAYRQVVTDAAELLSDIISLDIPDYNGVDDVEFRVILNAIDGSGGHLAYGGSLADRPDSSLPYESFIRLDEADVASRLDGNLSDVVFHELLHGLGFGTEWSEMGLVQNIGGSLRFVGENAVNAYNALYPDAAGNDPYSDQGVPLDNSGSHWAQSIDGREVMTPALYPSNNYVSDMTLAALEDMGYETAYPDEPEEIAALVV